MIVSILATSYLIDECEMPIDRNANYEILRCDAFPSNSFGT